MNKTKYHACTSCLYLFFCDLAYFCFGFAPFFFCTFILCFLLSVMSNASVDRLATTANTKITTARITHFSLKHISSSGEMLV